jgi:hypothetical protein
MDNLTYTKLQQYEILKSNLLIPAVLLKIVQEYSYDPEVKIGEPIEYFRKYKIFSKYGIYL